MAGEVVHLWSAPRCCSTSLMYSFAQRADVAAVLDEPLYPAWLRAHPEAERPYRAELLASSEADVHEAMEAVAAAAAKAGPGRLVFAKHIAKQADGLRREELLDPAFQRHIFLFRRPLDVLASWTEVAAATLDETAFPQLVAMHALLREAGRKVVLVDADELLADPEGVLRAACAGIDLPFLTAMLRWPAGPKPFDGLWAPHWYATTHAATGFQARAQAQKKKRKRKAVPQAAREVISHALPFYECLLAQTAAAPRGPAAAGKKKEGGTHVYEADERNKDVLVGVRDGLTLKFHLVWRPCAKVSILDSNFLLGDGVWEGIRLHRSVLAFGAAHIRRLFDNAKALNMDLHISPAELEDLVYQTCDANGMDSGVHIRLMVSRGLKPTPYQNPATTLGHPGIFILPEHKRASDGPKEKGIRLHTCHVRRSAPDMQDQQLNTHSKLNCIAACIQANQVGVEESLMLDPHGFVATCNSTNFFIVRDGAVITPTTKYQLPGITRANVIRLCRDNGISCVETDFTLMSVYSADEAFVTGTFAGQIPVTEVDGRVIGSGGRGPVTERLQGLYKALMEATVARSERYTGGGAAGKEGG